ncbi:protein of unknown function [Chitinophaga sp. YR627]|uniref:YfbM family protein n=1 Tax=Chitinophaga sp. YR627 TaxID=1881041 RepID=UPI0008EF7CAA|nr:YfbM family protein [Chitinophaga sp. YR627]SFO88665.1 protein of unknown function [Chitinophaga sp. YR627]
MSMTVKLLRVTQAEFEAYQKNSSLLGNRFYSDSETDSALIYLDKSWEGILFLLTGQGLKKNRHPMLKVFFSEQNVDDNMDLGYGPAEYLTAEEVKQLYAELSKITEEELTARFDPARMTELHIYPEIWDEEGILHYLLAFFNELLGFYRQAAANDQIVISGIL